MVLRPGVGCGLVQSSANARGLRLLVTRILFHASRPPNGGEAAVTRLRQTGKVTARSTKRLSSSLLEQPSQVGLQCRLWRRLRQPTMRDRCGHLPMDSRPSTSSRHSRSCIYMWRPRRPWMWSWPMQLLDWHARRRDLRRGKMREGERNGGQQVANRRSAMMDAPSRRAGQAQLGCRRLSPLNSKPTTCTNGRTWMCSRIGQLLPRLLFHQMLGERPMRHLVATTPTRRKYKVPSNGDIPMTTYRWQYTNGMYKVPDDGNMMVVQNPCVRGIAGRRSPERWQCLSLNGTCPPPPPRAGPVRSK